MTPALRADVRKCRTFHKLIETRMDLRGFARGWYKVGVSHGQRVLYEGITEPEYADLVTREEAP